MKEWKVGKLKEILKLCEPENIFNADETGLFWPHSHGHSLLGLPFISCFTFYIVLNKQSSMVIKKQDCEYCISCGKHE